MPHAEGDTMGEPVVNGEKPYSQFLSVSIPGMPAAEYDSNRPISNSI
jgi:hypothetical protein